jgi:hypothetical protein
MVRRPLVTVSVLCLCLLAFHSSPTFGQSASSVITGTVRDTTGAVMPGVTVEASSPVLIEKIRSAVTDEQGQYRIIDLRPGMYTVTYTLTGFSTVKREGIELQPSFTATINVELRVGSLEETITVAGSSPIVDIQNVQDRKVLPQDVLNALPTLRTPQSFVPYIPGVQGGLGEIGRDTANLSIHGSRGEKPTLLSMDLKITVCRGPEAPRSSTTSTRAACRRLRLKSAVSPPSSSRRASGRT